MTWFVLATALAADIALVVVDPTTGGTTRAQVVLHPDAAGKAGAADAFRFVPTGGGVGRVTKATPLTTAGGGTRTHLVFDQSGSFRAHWRRAFELAGEFSSALPADHTVDVSTFGSASTAHGSASDPTALGALLATARGSPSQNITRLHALVKDATESVARGLPLDRGGLRQIVVFTDLGEEGTFTDRDVIDTARSFGVRVNLVAFVPKQQKGEKPPKRIDDAKRIAESTGGFYVQVDAASDADARRELAAAATAGSRTWWLDVAFCDVPSGKGLEFGDSAQAELWSGGHRAAASAAFPFRQQADATTTAPCEVAPKTPDPPPDPIPEPVSDDLPGWIWALALLPLALLALLLLPLLAALRRAPAEPSAPPGPRSKPAPPVEQATADAREGTRSADVFAPVDPSLLERLPTTRLVKVSGGASIPARVEIDRKRLTVGAVAGNDLVLDSDTVSGKHAHLELFADGALWVCDDGSTNGTLVGGERLASGARRKLVHGDTVGFGRTVVFRVEQPDLAPRESAKAPPPAEPPTRERARTTFKPLKPNGSGK